MYSYPSRSEEREVRFTKNAKKGLLSAEGIIVYPGEMRKLEKSGLYISNVEPAKIKGSPNLFKVNVDWSHAYPKGIPHMVYSYINHLTETYPKSYVKNLAHELFITAQRENLKRSK